MHNLFIYFICVHARICTCRWCKKKPRKSRRKQKRWYFWIGRWKWKRATKGRKFPDNRRGNTRVMTTFSYLNYGIINWNVLRYTRGCSTKMRCGEGCCFFLQREGIPRFTRQKFLSFLGDCMREKLDRKNSSRANSRLINLQASLIGLRFW